jgi:hypothetical protein
MEYVKKLCTYIWTSLYAGNVNKDKYINIVYKNSNTISRILKLYINCQMKKNYSVNKWNNKALYSWYSVLDIEDKKDIIKTVIEYIYKYKDTYAFTVNNLEDLDLIINLLRKSSFGVISWYSVMIDDYIILQQNKYRTKSEINIDIQSILNDKRRVLDVSRWRLINNLRKKRG